MVKDFVNTGQLPAMEGGQVSLGYEWKSTSTNRAVLLLEASERVCMAVAGVFIVGIAVLNFLDALLRYLFNKPISGAIEITSLAIIPIAYLALSVTQAEAKHIRILVLTEHLHGSARMGIEALAKVMGLAIIALVIWQGIVQTGNAFRTGDYLMGPVHVTTWPFRLIVPVGFALLFLRFVMGLVGDIKSVIGNKSAA